LGSACEWVRTVVAMRGGAGSFAVSASRVGAPSSDQRRVAPSASAQIVVKHTLRAVSSNYHPKMAFEGHKKNWLRTLLVFGEIIKGRKLRIY
jgi:hypothetical protein